MSPKVQTQALAADLVRVATDVGCCEEGRRAMGEDPAECGSPLHQGGRAT
jgi:hypothetical protein